MKTLSFFVILCMAIYCRHVSAIEDNQEDDDLELAENMHLFKDDIVALMTGTFQSSNLEATKLFPENITFYLFTKEEPIEFTRIDPNNPDLITRTDINYVFIIHGWLESRRKQWYQDLTNAFLQRSDIAFNVIQVDWKGPALQRYEVSALNTAYVGKIVGDFIVKLHTEKSIPLERFDVVGHSLGGQVAGFVGQEVIAQTKNKLPRITALDAAGPLFVMRTDDERLSRDDGQVVVAIHTDGGKLGFSNSTGTLDFFPNGGSEQPGCVAIDITDPKSLINPVACDHFRSWEYFIEAVSNPDLYAATKCRMEGRIIKHRVCCDDDDVVTMGNLTTTKEGDYYLGTNSQKPYGMKTYIFDINNLIMPGPELHSEDNLCI